MIEPTKYVEECLPCMGALRCDDSPKCGNCIARPDVERAMRQYAAAVLRESAQLIGPDRQAIRALAAQLEED